MAGIIGYGTFVPQCRMAIEEVFDMWPYPYPPDSIKALLGLVERTVNRTDEDPCTMATDAVSGEDGSLIGRVFSNHKYCTHLDRRRL